VNTEAEAIWPTLDPATASIVVVEDDGQIVGCHVLYYVLHADGLWIHPDHRGKTSVGRRLWAGVQRLVRAHRVPGLVTAAIDERVCGLLTHVGAVPLPGQHFVIPMRSK
jgi:hypothetical protein